MSLARHAKRRDANEREIVNTLKRAGCLVAKTDIVDLIVQRGAETMLIECKTKTGTRTALQRQMEADGWRVHIVRTPEEALKAVGL